MELTAGFQQDCKLKCVHCCKPLSVSPIYFDQEIGYICGRCIKHFEELVHTGCLKRAHAYEDVAKHIVFPCCNKFKGCNSRLRWNRVLQHEFSCIIKLKCPFTACFWKGDNHEIKAHLYRSHAKHLARNFPIKPSTCRTQLFVEASGRMFFIEFEVPNNRSTPATCAVKCIQNKHEFEHKIFQFIIKTRHVVTKSEVKIQDHVQSYTASISGCRRSLRNNATRDQLLIEEIRIFRKSSIEIAQANRKLNIVTPLSIETIINIKRKGILKTLSISGNTDKKLWEELECPVCFNCMVSPIFLCSMGHSICNACKYKVNSCPICRSTLGNSRNFTLENVVSLLKFTGK